MKDNCDIQFPIEIVNEDGTSVDDMPQNPLMEKWLSLYPPMRYGEPCSTVLGEYEDGRKIMNYSCVLCHNEMCPHSDSWEIPKEDLEEWNQYQEAVKEYHRAHNPSLYEKAYNL